MNLIEEPCRTEKVHGCDRRSQIPRQTRPLLFGRCSRKASVPPLMRFAKIRVSGNDPRSVAVILLDRRAIWHIEKYFLY